MPTPNINTRAISVLKSCSVCISLLVVKPQRLLTENKIANTEDAWNLACSSV